jgi:hypothetical protein
MLHGPFHKTLRRILHTEDIGVPNASDMLPVNATQIRIGQIRVHQRRVREVRSSQVRVRKIAVI